MYDLVGKHRVLPQAYGGHNVALHDLVRFARRTDVIGGLDELRSSRLDGAANTGAAFRDLKSKVNIAPKIVI